MSPDYRVIIGDSRRMSEVTDGSVHLTVTSPPYPMVSIWDGFFAEASALSYDDMHEYLNETWREVRRVLVPGGIACINIGDATRTSTASSTSTRTTPESSKTSKSSGSSLCPTCSGRSLPTGPTTKAKEPSSGPDSFHRTPM